MDKNTKGQKIRFSTASIARDYEKSLKDLRNEILATISYWIVPMFDKQMLQDSKAFDNKKNLSIKKMINDFGVGDIVKLKANPVVFKNMVIKKIENDRIYVDYFGHVYSYSKDELEKQVATIAYSKDDTILDRIEKVKSNILTITDFRATQIAKRLLRKSLKSINNNFLRMANITYQDFQDSEGLRDKLQLMFQNNKSLIKSISQDILKNLDSTLQNATLGGDRASIINELKNIKNTTNTQIERIARDQTAKSLVGISSIRAEEAGFEYYEWLTADDERVSSGKGGHKQLHGKIFRYDTPEAVIDSKGTKGHPAQRVNCRCTQAPIYLSINEKMIKDKIGYKIVNK